MMTILGGLIPVLIAAFILRCLWLDFVKRPQQLSETWSEIAQRTGLTFDPGQRGLFGNGREPMVYGEYRGRSLTMAKLVVNECSGDACVPAVYTRISLRVLNTRGFLLNLEEKHIFARLFRKKGVASGAKDLDKHFVAQGSPSEFVQRALRLLVLQQVILSQRPAGVIMLTDNSFSAISSSRPSSNLKGSNLVCRLSGVLTDVGVQIAFLDLLCDLAELAETMQKQVVTPVAWFGASHRVLAARRPS